MPALSTVRLAVSLVYSAGRKLLVLIILATIVTSVAIAGQLVVGRTIVDLLAENDDVSAGDLTPYLLTLGVLLMLSALSQAVSSELRIPLGEQVHRRAMDEILDVATEAELEMYEGPEFHDRMQRARVAAGGQSAAVVFGLVTMASTLIVAFG